MDRNKIILCMLLSLGLTACSPEKIFSQLARTEVEEGAAEAIRRQQAQQQQLERIEAKKTAFPYYTVLSPVDSQNSHQAIAYRNWYQIDKKSIIDIEAIAPDPAGLAYLVWIKSPAAKEYLKLGQLSAQAADGHTFYYDTQDDLTGRSIIAISLDDPEIATPANLILTGQFPPVGETQ